jgi:glycosyltransferase involved in cell wall biosynthesis
MDFLVLSHLRWNFVFQRPQQLMTRCSKSNRVFFWEEPMFDSEVASVKLEESSPGVYVAVPHLPSGLPDDEICRIQEWLLGQFVQEYSLQRPVLWYYTPMALAFSRGLESSVVVYDCMDELSAFRGAPPGLRALESELLSRADLVFTGGQTLYESKKKHHSFVHCFPSSIDRKFFETARRIKADPADQAGIPRPRLGYCGVIDERMETELLRAVAEARPDWHIVMVGPVVKISESDLPHCENIHFLGGKEYRTLPSYMAGWDVGLLPFAKNESTRFISPTKTPEYLAAGLPVVSTSITDVVRPYGSNGLVHIADTCDEFVAAVQKAIPSRNSKQRLAKVDAFLAHTSWDETWGRMADEIEAILRDNSLRGPSRLLRRPSTSVGSTATAD